MMQKVKTEPKAKEDKSFNTNYELRGDPDIRIRINGTEVGQFSDYKYGMELEAGLYDIEFYKEGMNL